MVLLLHLATSPGDFHRFTPMNMLILRPTHFPIRANAQKEHHSKSGLVIMIDFFTDDYFLIICQSCSIKWFDFKPEESHFAKFSDFHSSLIQRS